MNEGNTQPRPAHGHQLFMLALCVYAILALVVERFFFGTFSGFVAAWFLAPAATKNRNELETIRREILELRAMLEPVANAAAIRGNKRQPD